MADKRISDFDSIQSNQDSDLLLVSVNGVTYNETAQTLKAYASAGTVKYDSTQNLTSAQQQQARSNIGAASASSVSDLDDEKADRSELPVDVSELVNDAGYVTSDIINPHWIDIPLASGIVTPATSGETVDGVLWPYGGGRAQIGKIGNHVYIRGSIQVSVPSAGNKTIATIPADYRPTVGSKITFKTITGKNIARLAVRPDGDIKIEWIIKVSDASAITSSTWFQLDCDYWIDEVN